MIMIKVIFETCFVAVNPVLSDRYNDCNTQTNPNCYWNTRFKGLVVKL